MIGLIQPKSSLSHHELMVQIVRLLKITAQLRFELEAQELELYRYIRQHRILSKECN